MINVTYVDFGILIGLSCLKSQRGKEPREVRNQEAPRCRNLRVGRGPNPASHCDGHGP